MANRGSGARAVNYAGGGLFHLFAALPFAWMIFSIFKQDSDLYNAANNPFLYNEPPTLTHIDLLFTDTSYTTFILNTIAVAVMVVLITLAAAVPAAYSLTRLAG